MKSLLSTLVLFFFLHEAVGQSSIKDSSLTSLLKLDLGSQGIGASYELKFSGKTTLDLAIGVGGGYDISEDEVSYKLSYGAAYFRANPRLYYNLRKRIARGKPVALNNGNYIGASLLFSYPVATTSDFIRTSVLGNVHWGIQRQIGKKWLFNTHVGVGYAQDIDYSFGTIYPAAGFRFCYVLRQ